MHVNNPPTPTPTPLQRPRCAVMENRVESRKQFTHLKPERPEPCATQWETRDVPTIR